MKTPRLYQAEDIEWILGTPNRAKPAGVKHPDSCVYSAQPGLGKTGVAASVHERLHATHGALVICPAIALPTWRDEPAKWGLGFSTEVVKTRAAWRWPEPGKLRAISFASLPWTPKQIRDAQDEGKKPGPPIGAPAWPIHLIVDECQNLRSNKSQRAIRTRGIRTKCAKVTGLSGTPVGGHPRHIYNMLGALGCRPWEWFEFLRKFGGRKGFHGGIEFDTDLKGNYCVSPAVRLDLEPVLRRRLRVDVAPELPAVITRYRVIPHKREAKAALKALDNALATHYARDTLPELPFFAIVDRLVAEERIPHIPKAQQEREERGEIGLIFAAHTAPILKAAERPGWASIYGATSRAARERHVRDFEAGRLKGLAINIKTAATALDLPSADYVTFIDTTWDPDETEQATDRANRLSRVKGPIEAEFWISDHAVCEHRRKVQKRKRGLSSAVLGE